MRRSDEYQEVQAVAKEEARERNFTRVGARYLLLAMLTVTNNAGYLILKRLLEEQGHTITSLRDKLDRAISIGIGDDLDPEPSFSNKALKIFKYAAVLAANKGFTEVGCDHLLCALVEIKSDASEILAHYDINLKVVQHEMEAVLIF